MVSVLFPTWLDCLNGVIKNSNRRAGKIELQKSGCWLKCTEDGSDESVLTDETRIRPLRKNERELFSMTASKQESICVDRRRIEE